MAALAKGQTSDCANPVLDVFIEKSGTPIDPAVLERIIFDVTSGVPVQLDPAVGRQAIDLTDCPTGERLSVGHYVTTYTVPTSGPGSTPGTYRTKWFFKETLTSPEFTFEEEWTVLDIPVAGPGDFYVNVPDFRALGITAAMISDADLEAQIMLCQAFLERATRQWFNPRQLDFFFDGTDSDTIHFGIPIISIDFLRINESTDDLDTSLFKIYSGRSYPDDRRNPRIKLVHNEQNRDIFTAPLQLGRLLFRKGRQNARVAGQFGFIEDDGSTPEMIKHALTKLVIEKLTNPVFVDPASTSTPIPAPPSGSTGVRVEERTDGHSVKFAVAAISGRRPGLSGFTTDQQILDIIKLYRAPLGVATPSHWTVQPSS